SCGCVVLSQDSGCAEGGATNAADARPQQPRYPVARLCRGPCDPERGNRSCTQWQEAAHEGASRRREAFICSHVRQVIDRWAYPRLVAHRGGGTLAPENTLAGMRLAHGYGYRAVEFDVMLSVDEVPVLMHDPAFGRTLPG